MTNTRESETHEALLAADQVLSDAAEVTMAMFEIIRKHGLLHEMGVAVGLKIEGICQNADVARAKCHAVLGRIA